MNKHQGKIIHYIRDRAKRIGETVLVEKSESGLAFITIQGDDCYLFVILGKRGGVKNVYYRDTLNIYTSKEDSEAGVYHITSFFDDIERQRGRSELSKDDLADLKYIAKKYASMISKGIIEDHQISADEISDLVNKIQRVAA